MATLLLPGLARDMTALNHRAAAAIAAEKRQIEGLQDKADESHALRQRAGRGARQAIRQALGNAPGALAIWQTAREVMQNGLSGESLKELLQEIRAVIETWLALAENAREMGKLATALGAPASDLQELLQKEAELNEVRLTIEQLGAFATRTRQPVDPALLQQGREEIAVGK